MMGFLNIDKPQGMTSFDVIAVLRRVLKIKQIGHAGTLDPLATGVLPIAVGKAARLIEFLPKGKEYIAELEFGKVSDTYDSEGRVEEVSGEIVSEAGMKLHLEKFVGEIEQLPPMYSAVSYKGERLYKLARRGETVENLPLRKVFVQEIEVLDFSFERQSAVMRIKCSEGTYIRSIIHDLGRSLGSGAVMTGLRRTESASLRIDSAISLADIKTISDAEKSLINPICFFPENNVELDEEKYNKIKNGQSVEYKLDKWKDGEPLILVYKGGVCALAVRENNFLIMRKVFV